MIARGGVLVAPLSNGSVVSSVPNTLSEPLAGRLGPPVQRAVPVESAPSATTLEKRVAPVVEFLRGLVHDAPGHLRDYSDVSKEQFQDVLWDSQSTEGLRPDILLAEVSDLHLRRWKELSREFLSMELTWPIFVQKLVALGHELRVIYSSFDVSVRNYMLAVIRICGFCKTFIKQEGPRRVGQWDQRFYFCLGNSAVSQLESTLDRDRFRNIQKKAARRRMAATPSNMMKPSLHVSSAVAVAGSSQVVACQGTSSNVQQMNQLLYNQQKAQLELWAGINGLSG